MSVGNVAFMLGFAFGGIFGFLFAAVLVVGDDER
jgi:hypothetical protein